MEKKQSEVLRSNKLQIGEEGASHLVGSIIEKGISDKFQSKSFSPTPPPKPTVLPFPTARHRSHGPHWGLISSNRGNNDDNDDIEDDDEDNDIIDAYPTAAFANPVQRKNKKDLDFRRWQELIQSDESLGGRKIEEKVSSSAKSERKSKDGKKLKIANKRNISCGSPLVDKDAFIPMETDVKTDSNSCLPLDKPKEAVASSSGFELVDSVSHMELDNRNQIHHLENVKDSSTDMMPMNSQLGAEIMSHDDWMEAHFEKMEKIDPALPGVLKNRDKKSSANNVFSSRPSNIGNQREAMSIESEIDVENCARLQRMSPDEIAQAQAEIMEKMDPTLLNLLKKRGQDKLKKQKCAGSVLATNAEATTILDESQSIQDAKGSPQLDRDASHSQSRQDTGVVQKTGPAGGTLWNAWSKRVEAVRELRFSLDGSVILCDFGPESESSDNSAQNMLGANNVAERDFLRTEGDPGAAGYTIREAVALSRSTVPGQRAFALNLLASVLDKALHSFCENQVGCALRYDKIERSIDWEAVWAYALGPEPELVLLLRMSLDDNHNSVVLACLKVIQCTLSCDLNQYFFDISEKIAVFEKDIFTAPVFRSKPEIDLGFLHGGYWKYNAKPSNILPFGEEIMDDETEGKHTIQDDLVVAGQDFTAGLVRMGILPRLRYILETDPTMAMEEYIIFILIAIARHSPTCANAILNCERLVQTVVQRFTLNNSGEVQPAKIKSVCLLKVLARSDKKNCREFVKSGLFQTMTWHLYRPFSSLEQWVNMGRENCKFSTCLMVEQLRFWKVCIRSGYGVSYFQDVFPALCLWLNPPSFEKLIENNLLSEFASISVEVYLVLEALAARLPKFYSQEHSECGDDNEAWSWGHIGPMIDAAMKWLVLKNELFTTNFLERQNVIRDEFDFQDSSACPLLWVYSAIMLFFARVLEKIGPEDSINQHGSGKHLPWLPEFVPKIGLEIIKNGFLSFVDTHGSRYGTHFAQGISFVEELCHLRRQSEYETSLASVSCLHGLVQVIVSIDNLIQLAKPGIHYSTCQGYNLCREEKMLQDGILTGCLVELRCVLKFFVDLATSGWNYVQSIEKFGRGGPAPGVGHGWGASCGGFWSSTVLLAQMDARFIIHLLEIFQVISFCELRTDEDMTFAMQIINATLGICLTAGPRDEIIVQKALKILLQAPVLKYLDLCIRRFLQVNKTAKLFGWEYKEEDYLHLSKILLLHFKNRWLGKKRKLKSIVENSGSGGKTFKKGTATLHTIPEDIDPSNITSQDHSCSLAVEWAHQRLPLPMHWFLSPIATIRHGEHAGIQSVSKMLNFVQDPHVLEVAKGGLFFLLGIEAVATFLYTKVISPVRSVPLFWKLHSLSVILLAGMGVLEDERSRDVFEALQGHYGQLLDDAWASRSTELVLDRDVNLLPGTGKNCNLELLKFQSGIHDSYSTYVETLVEQFAAVSYGDLLYGRQVGIYLHRCVEAPVRLAAWNSLSNARVLELLPPLEKCFAKAEGYLEPVEDNEEILEAYMKSWISGALDRAATRQSMAFTLVLHHLSSFLFGLHASDKLLVRNKLAKSLLRDYSRQRQHERMMFDLMRYSKISKSQILEQNEDSSLQQSNIDKRFEVLTEACEGNSPLLIQVEKLKTYVISTLL